MVAICTLPNPLMAVNAEPDAHVTLIGNHFEPNPNGEPLEYIGLKITMPAGWKTYWYAIGLTGIPPVFDYSLSKNLEEFKILYPVPKIADEFGLRTFIYEDEVVIPVIITRADSSQDIQLIIDAKFAICKDICIPIQKRAEITLKPYQNIIKNPEITNALQRTPLPLDYKTNFLRATMDGNHLKISSNYSGEFIITNNKNMALDGILVNGQAEVTLPKEFSLPLQLTLLGDKPAVSTVEIMTTAGYDNQLWYIILLAFLGGVLLNIMACVLPTLAIKLRAITTSNERTRSKITMMIAGIMAFFMLLAFIFTALKLFGVRLGWGLQFQSPLFIVFLMVVIGYFARSMLGIQYKILLPPMLNKALSSILGKNNDNKEHFVSGFLSALLATPCSAPLVGTAVSFALGGDASQIAPIMLAMGLGFALPWLVFLVYPHLPAKFMRLGAITTWLELVFAFLLCLVFLWLWSILYGLLGLPAMVVGSLVLLAILLPMVSARVKRMVIGILLIISVGLAVILPISGEKISKQREAWGAFSPAIILENRNQGIPTLVNVSAEWCLTCKVNALRVFDQDEFYSLAHQRNWQLIYADWTKPNEEIRNFLQQYGKFGIPFTIFYDQNRGIHILPEIVSLQDLKDLP